ncbi:hypothetical protein EYF80_009193 [Liparis tanakae]|uniref:Uncharacterized protein n=1 Tax=Liparis tanakae TaxID=230148 RepID=A0A4Z2ISG2_9TELE|nr:hypothetical protein EYF80_009193 [Liparis tanakae]
MKSVLEGRISTLYRIEDAEKLMDTIIFSPAQTDNLRPSLCHHLPAPITVPEASCVRLGAEPKALVSATPSHHELWSFVLALGAIEHDPRHLVYLLVPGTSSPMTFDPSGVLSVIRCPAPVCLAHSAVRDISTNVLSRVAMCNDSRPRVKPVAKMPPELCTRVAAVIDRDCHGRNPPVALAPTDT